MRHWVRRSGRLLCFFMHLLQKLSDVPGHRSSLSSAVEKADGNPISHELVSPHLCAALLCQGHQCVLHDILFTFGYGCLRRPSSSSSARHNSLVTPNDSFQTMPATTSGARFITSIALIILQFRGNLPNLQGVDKRFTNR